MTFDILRHYASLPEKTVEDIAKVIDHPENGMTLELNAHLGFDKFAWSLKMKDVSCNEVFCASQRFKFVRQQTCTTSYIM
jgi:hypothetical protein